KWMSSRSGSSSALVLCLFHPLLMTPPTIGKIVGGVYWKPIYNLLEGDFEILVVNAHHLKTVPGRKTDVKDAEWIADLLQHGLLKASFIPSAPQRELRDLTRYRTRLTEERAREVNRLQKTLEDTNLKLGDVVSDVMGKASQMILHAIVNGETNPARLAAFAVGRVRANQQDLEAALRGKVTAHHRFMLGEHLKQIESLDAAIRRVSQEIARRFTPPDEPQGEGTDEPGIVQDREALLEASSRLPCAQGMNWQQAVERIDAITGISKETAQGILAEIGIEMAQFPSAQHVASWAGVCPGNHESAGKRLSGKARKGNPWVRRLLVQAAHAAAHSKNTYLSAQYHRIASRRRAKKAALAVAHSILVIIYHILRDRSTYQDLGGNYFDERDRQMVQKRLVRRLERLGYQVEIQPLAQAG
ncbi:MAG: IS110 family transposase, partial [Ktedonobacteraceae bacterium]|nr:IS110 family transposase [Ktedonobacteraceae bacterium]